MIFIHQPVHFFVVNDKLKLFQIIGDHMIAITAKRLAKNLSNDSNNRFVTYYRPIRLARKCTWPGATASTHGPVIKYTPGKCKPITEPVSSTIFPELIDHSYFLFG